MQVLVIVEHAGGTIRPGSRSAITFARSVAESNGGEVELLLLGHELDSASLDAASYAPVLVADHVELTDPVADRYAQVIAQVVTAQDADLVVAASTTFAKDIVGRTGGLLGGAMASDILGHEWVEDQLVMQRPMYAGAVIARVVLTGQPAIVTVRASAYEPAERSSQVHAVKTIGIDAATLPTLIQHEKTEARTSHRPDVTEARVVVSGGRGIKNSDDFEQLVGGLADALQGATGSSRALVDAGITPNELQVGQTGKIVAPELYIAVGISGAVQHLAGMKNSRIIVAINQDPDAPIFDVADFGLVGDAYEIVPQLIEKLAASQPDH
ncbi:MAG: electron transfer flavoprotein subunit alpha/FixB family protein [Planctomycetaceae bacterium]|nr:electron transfer flavoprotein subunit alpha/FixB family protein [Planctomycetaceae bacterium]